MPFLLRLRSRGQTCHAARRILGQGHSFLGGESQICLHCTLRRRIGGQGFPLSWSNHDDNRSMPLWGNSLGELGTAGCHARVLVQGVPVSRCRQRNGQRVLSHGDIRGAGQTSDYPSVADSGNQMHRRFCPSCGTPLFSEAEARPHLIFVRVGTFDDPNLANPAMTIWTSSAPRWACISPELPQVVKQPPPAA